MPVSLYGLPNIDALGGLAQKIAENFDIMWGHMADRYARWGIEQSLRRDIRIVFKTVGAMVAVLRITLPTWIKLKSEQGVRYNTAINVVKRFFEVLREFSEGEELPAGSYETYARDMLKKYAEDISDHSFEQFVHPIETAVNGGESDIQST